MIYSKRTKTMTIITIIISLLFINTNIIFANEEITDDKYINVSSDNIEDISLSEENTDYRQNEVIFKANTLEEALEYEKEYNGKLIFYNDGLGCLYIEDNVEDLFSNEKDTNISSVNHKVYPNYIYHINFGKKIELEDILSPINNNNNNELITTSVNDPFVNNSFQWFHDEVHTLNSIGTGYTGKDVVVAILDTGIDPDHIELKDKIRNTKSYFNNGSIEDDHGHGTHVAGLIAAEKNNNEGGIGIAPDVKLDIYKIAKKDGEVSSLYAIDAIKSAIKDKVNIISMSFGGKAIDPLLEEVIKEAYNNGITCVCAAGNDGEYTTDYPAALPETIAVGASIYSKEGLPKLAEYSNYGENVDVVAPGGENNFGEAITTSMNDNVYNTVLIQSHQGILSTYKNGKYAILSGTSMATPIVTGIVALCYESHPEFLKNHTSDTSKMIKNIIKSSTDKRIYVSSEGSIDKGQILANEVLFKNYEPEYTYSFMDETGNIGSNPYTYIARGKSSNIYIVPSGYNGEITKEIKNFNKNIVWESDNSLINIKKGKIKCNKKIPVNTIVKLSPKIPDNDEKISLHLIVIEPIKKIGISSPLKISATGEELNTTSKNYILLKKSNITLSQNKGYYLSDPISFLKEKGYVLSPAYKTKGQVWKGYKDIGEFKYIVSYPKKTVKNLHGYTDDKGTISMNFINEGVYKVIYKLPYGCNKKFTLYVEI